MVQLRSHRQKALTVAAAALLAVPAFGSGPAKADAVADFYKGKEITFIVGFSVGGSYGAYARMLAQHMSQYIPGQPNIVTKHRQGGGGSRAAGFLYNQAPKDGTMLGFLSDSLAVAQLMSMFEGARVTAAHTLAGRWIVSGLRLRAAGGCAGVYRNAGTGSADRQARAIEKVTARNLAVRPWKAIPFFLIVVFHGNGPGQYPAPFSLAQTPGCGVASVPCRVRV